MLLSFNDVMGNPTLIHEPDQGAWAIRTHSVSRCTPSASADILAFRPVYVPVGEDPAPHIEMCRKAARKFDQLYCNVPNRTEDKDYVTVYGVFPIPEALIGRVGPPTRRRRRQAEDEQEPGQRDLPLRQRKGSPEEDQQDHNRPPEPDRAGRPDNILFKFVEAFITDEARVAELKRPLKRGDNIGDGHIKQELAVPSTPC